MTRPSMVLRVLTVAGAVLAGACTDYSGPTGLADQPHEPLLSSAPQVPSEDPNVLGRAVAGFGGFFFDASDQPTVYLRDPDRRDAAERALAPFLQARGCIRHSSGCFEVTSTTASSRTGSPG